MKKYNQFCGLAKALDVVGERWTLLIIRDLLIGPRTYTELMESQEGITTNLLAERLKHLEASGLISKTKDGKTFFYNLTELGNALEPAILALGGWGAKIAKLEKDDRFDIAYGLISIRRRAKPIGKNWTIELRTPKRIFQIFEENGKISSYKGQIKIPDLVVSAEENILLSVFIRRSAWKELFEQGKLQIQFRNEKDLELINEFQACLQS
jgi:DNA-binding HxlR family transcriptional regulator